jgi:hypothetical protein
LRQRHGRAALGPGCPDLIITNAIAFQMGYRIVERGPVGA